MGRRGFGDGEEGDPANYRYAAVTGTDQNDFCTKMGSDESHFNVS